MTDPETIIADNQRAYTEVTGRLIADRDAWNASYHAANKERCQLAADRAELVRMLERVITNLENATRYYGAGSTGCTLCNSPRVSSVLYIQHKPTCLIAEANALIERMKGSR